MFRVRYRLCLLLAAFCPVAAHAGAWTLPPGDGMFIVTGSYDSADEFFDNSGNRIAQATYEKYEGMAYVEYGLADGITAGANLSYQRVRQDNAADNTNYGLGDSELFLRLRLWQQGNFVVSAEPLVKVPSPESSDDLPAIGSRHPDAGLGINAGFNFKALGLDHFVDTSLSYRYRFGDPEDQLRAGATLGLAVTPELMILPQAFFTWRMDDPATAAFTQSSGDDYDRTTLQLSVVYKFNEKLWLQAGAFSHIDGTNAGGGDGVLFAVWKKF
jgi:protein XagA